MKVAYRKEKISPYRPSSIYSINAPTKRASTTKTHPQQIAPHLIRRWRITCKGRCTFRRRAFWDAATAVNPPTNREPASRLRHGTSSTAALVVCELGIVRDDTCTRKRCRRDADEDDAARRRREDGQAGRRVSR